MEKADEGNWDRANREAQWAAGLLLVEARRGRQITPPDLPSFVHYDDMARSAQNGLRKSFDIYYFNDWSYKNLLWKNNTEET